MSFRTSILVSCLYALVAWVCIVTTKTGAVANLWFANGIGVAVLAVSSSRLPLNLALLGLANFLANVVSGNTWLLSLAFMVPNVAEMTLGAFLLKKNIPLDGLSKTPRELLRLVLIVCVGSSVIGAFLGATLLDYLGFAPFMAALTNWFVGDVLGMLAVLPVVLSGLSQSGSSPTSFSSNVSLWQDDSPYQQFKELRLLTLSGKFTAALFGVGGVTYLLITRFEFPFIWIVALTVCVATAFSYLQTAIVLLLVVIIVGLSISGGAYLYGVEHSQSGVGSAFLSLFLVQALTLFTSASVSELRNSRKRLKESLANAERASLAKSQFLANMSHEIRTPLNAIVGTVHSLGFTALAPDQAKQLDTLKVASRNLLSLVNDILDVSKIEAGELRLEAEVFPLDQLLTDATDLFAGQTKKKGIALRIGSRT